MVLYMRQQQQKCQCVVDVQTTEDTSRLKHTVVNYSPAREKKKHASPLSLQYVYVYPRNDLYVLCTVRNVHFYQHYEGIMYGNVLLPHQKHKNVSV